MKRPSLQFYPGDWTSNAKLKRCTFAERGIWLAVICLFHDEDEGQPYGVKRWPLKDIAQAVGCKVAELKSLAAKGVLKGGDDKIEPLIYTPRHAGKTGDPVTLIEAQDGPIWYSSRLVRDEYVRSKRGEGTRFEGEPKPTPKPSPKPPIGEPPKATPTHREGDGASTSSSSSTSINPKTQEQRSPTGSRLTLEVLPDEWRTYCTEQRPDLKPERVFQDFRDYWVAQPGRDGRKADWLATWRGWVRREKLQGVNGNGTGNGNSKFNVHAAGRRMLAEAVAAENLGHGPAQEVLPDVPE